MRKVILGLAPVVAAISGSAVAAEPVWKVSETSGDVRLVENGRAHAAVKGALLASGSTIATGPNARAVIVRGEEFVVISPRTQLRVPADTAPNRIMQIIEDFGTAVFKIQKKSTPHFGVQTPYLAAVVKGTTFTVTVGPQGGSVQVTEGAVQVSTLDGGAADLVRPGTIAMVGASDLFRLNVDGETSKVVRSPNAPAGAGSSDGPATRSAAYAGPKGQEVRIAKRFEEDRSSLKEATKGLVEKGSSQEMAQAEFREQAQAARKVGANPGNGDRHGKPDQADKPDPGKPDDARKPAEPGKGKDSDKPADPDKAKDPGRPDDTGKPADPEKAKDPGQRDDPGKAVNPDKAEETRKPSSPEEQPTDLGKPSDPGNSGPGKPTDTDKTAPDAPDGSGNKGSDKPTDSDAPDHDNKGPGGGGDEGPGRPDKDH